MIDLHLVSVNGDYEKPSYIVIEDDVIDIQNFVVDPEVYKIEGENIPLTILYKDDDLAVIDKPPGLVVHPGIGVKSGTLVHALTYHFGTLSEINGAHRAGIIHRLDKETSGLMVVALSNSAHVHIAGQFEQRIVKKKYIGMTWGNWERKSGSISGFINRKRTDPTSYRVATHGKAAETSYDVVFESNYLSEVEFTPKTGRTHQIRVHAASMLHPIFCDEKYGGGLNRIKGYIPETGIQLKNMINLIGRHALHASQLSFTHPVTKQPMHFNAPLPHDMQSLAERMRADDRI